jgi:hypothetical protein
VAGVQITRDPDPLATLMRGDPAGETNPVSNHPLHLCWIVHAGVDLLGRDRPPKRKNGVGLPCGDGVLLLFQLRNKLRELRGEEALGHTLILPKKTASNKGSSQDHSQMSRPQQA